VNANEFFVYSMELSPLRSEQRLKTFTHYNFCLAAKDRIVRNKMCHEYGMKNCSALMFCKLCCQKMVKILYKYECTKQCLNNTKMLDSKYLKK